MCRRSWCRTPITRGGPHGIRAGAGRAVNNGLKSGQIQRLRFRHSEVLGGRVLKVSRGAAFEGWDGEAGVPAVPEAVAFAADVEGGGVMEKPVEERDGERGFGEDLVP